MENWLEYIRQNTNSKTQRAIITAIIVLLVLAGLVGLFGDLGFSDEIANYRWQIVVMLITLAIVSTLIFLLVRESEQGSISIKRIKELEQKLAEEQNKVTASTQQIGRLEQELTEAKDKVTTYHQQIGRLEQELTEAKDSEESLLRLMEIYKRDAYTEIVDYLKRIALLSINRQKWQEANARVERVWVKAHSDAEDIDPEFATKDRIEVIINIGTRNGVVKDMEFLVKDPTIPEVYGAIVVKEVYSKGAKCILKEYPGHSFWAGVLEFAEKGIPRVVEMSDNWVDPSLPPVLDNLTPELAGELLLLVEKIALNEQTGATS